MKKIIIMSILTASICFATDTFAEHEAKMLQMQERTQSQNGDGSGQQKRNQYRNGGQSGGTATQDGTGNRYKGSKGSGGGKGQR